MKIIVLDDEGNTLFEKDNPGHIHLPLIMNGMHDIDCDDNDCPDPRCIERREQCETLLSAWHRKGQELAFAYHFQQHKAEDERDIDEFERLPNFRKPHKVQICSFTRNEIVFSSGERIAFLLPNLNPTGNEQVTFSTEKWDASLYPWRGDRDKERAKSAAK
jgi:hypothetical protein